MKRIATTKRAVIILALLASSAVHAQTYTEVWHDVRKPWRSNWEMDAAVKADADICDHEVGEQHGGPSAKYKRCMAKRHWKFAHVVRNRQYAAPASDPYSETTPVDTSAPYSPPTPPDSQPQPIYEPPAPVDIHPFCPNPIC